jgi:hypothetical protein
VQLARLEEQLTAERQRYAEYEEAVGVLRQELDERRRPWWRRRR